MIRNFKDKNLEVIMELWLETNISAHAFIDNNYWRGHFNMVKEMMNNADIYVYEINGIIQGFVGLIDNYIGGIFVSKKMQSKGVGKQLLNHVKQINKKLSLSVYKKNDRAYNFYINEGFEIVKEKIDEGTNEIEFVMEWIK